MKQRALGVFLLGLFFSTVPLFARAAGLVNCGVGSGIANATSCQACSLVQLAQNILNFTIGLSIPIAMGLIAWSGVLYFTSNSNEQKLATAKKIFKSAFVGFLITISAWLFINTFLRIILDPGQFRDGSWFTVECVAPENRPISTSITSWIAQSLPGISRDPVRYGINSQTTQNGSSGTNTFTPAMENAVTDALTARCAAGDQVSCEAAGGDILKNGQITDEALEALLAACDDGDDKSCAALAKVVPETPLGGDNTGACNATAVAEAANAGGYELTSRQASILACFAGPESSCGTNLSGARTREGVPSSAYGAFQIVISLPDDCHSLNIDACTQAAQNAGYNVSGKLNCSTAVYQGKPKGQYASMSSTDPDNLGQACIAAAVNFTCNSAAAACLIKRNPSGSDWTGSTDGLDHSKQSSCVSS